MKTLLTTAFTTLLIMGCLLTAPEAIANSDRPAKSSAFDTSMYVDKANRIRIAIAKTAVFPLTVNLRQAGSKTILFSRLVSPRQDQVVYLLNVDELADGQYEVEIKSDSKTIVKQVSLGFPGVVVPQRLLTVY